MYKIQVIHCRLNVLMWICSSWEPNQPLEKKQDFITRQEYKDKFIVLNNYLIKHL